MLSTALRKHALKSTLATGILAAALAPFIPANAAAAVGYTIHKDLTYRGVRLSLYHGTLTWESSTRFQVSFVLCRDSSFTDPSVRLYVNGRYHSFYGFTGPRVTSTWCTNYGVQHDPPAVEPGGAVGNITLEIRGVHFNPSNNLATDRVESELYDNPFN